MTIASDTPGKDLRFKVEDGVITIPLAAKGRYAVAEGTARKVTLSPEDAQAMRDHEAEELGQPVDNSQPLPTHIVKLEGTGAVIRDQL
jgi:diketogulonate reductase-like aldo/keto reductase